MNRLEWLAGPALACLVFGTLPAVADMSGTTWPEEEEEEAEAEDEDADEAEDEATDDEEEKGCSHVLRPHNLAVVGAGLLVFTVVARRDPRPV